MYKTGTRNQLTSATDAARYPTSAYLVFKYQYTALSYHIHSPPSEEPKRKRGGAEGSKNGNLQSKQSYIHTVQATGITSKQSEMYQSLCITS